MLIKAFSFVLLPVLIGIGIYLYRFGWVDIQTKVTSWVTYTLPDFLWLFALLQSMRLIWQAEKRIWFWLILCTLLSIGSETLQLHGYIPGTFDYLDITAYFIAFLIVSIQTSIPQFKLFQYENIP